jgi:2'-5' RNA ligase
MRLFVAVDLPAAVHGWTTAAAAMLRARLAASTSRIAWVTPDRLHLTLVFLGEVADTVGEHAVARFAPALDAPSFPVRLGGAGVFPATGRPRVLWLGLEEGQGGLAAAQRAVLVRLDGVAFRREDRPFAPHLTLARFKDGGTGSDRRAIASAPVGTSARALVDHVTLYRSRLGPRGPDYVALANAPLTAGDRE